MPGLLFEPRSNSKGSAIAAVVDTRAQLVAQGYDVSNRAMGNPGLSPNDMVKQAIKDSVDQSRSVYGGPYGYLKLRQEIARDATHHYGEEFTTSNVIATAGSAMALDAIQYCVGREGTYGALIVPTYTSFSGPIKKYGGDVLTIPSLGKEQGYKPDVAAIEAAFEKAFSEGKPIRSIILNYPNNPTGAVLSESDAKILADKLNDLNARYGQEDGFIVILDDAYRDIYFNEAKSYSPYPYFSDDLKNKTVITCSASKSAALPQERAGGAICKDSKIIDRMRLSQSAAILCPPAVASAGYITYLEGRTQESEQSIRDYYQAKSNYVVESVNAMAKRAGWPKEDYPIAVNPGGAIFTFMDLSRMIGYELPETMKADLGKDFIENSTDISNYFMYISKLRSPQNDTLFKGVAMVPSQGCLAGEVPGMQGCVRFCISGEHDTPMAQDIPLQSDLQAMEHALEYIQSINRHRIQAANDTGLDSDYEGSRRYSKRLHEKPRWTDQIGEDRAAKRHCP